MTRCTVLPLPYQADATHYFRCIRQAPGAVLLDSGHPASHYGRYDLMSAWPQRVFSAANSQGKDFFQCLRTALAQLGPAEEPEGIRVPFVGGLIGYLSYDFGRRLEKIPRHSQNDIGFPDSHFGLYTWALISDHQARCTHLIFHPRTDKQERQRIRQLFTQPATSASLHPFKLTTPFSAVIDEQSYRQAIERIQRYIQAGDCYQVNYSQRFQASCEGDDWTAYQALRQVCPTPFAGYMHTEQGSILSFSPERFLQVRNGQVETRPIKGTRPRGQQPDADRALAEELCSSSKDRAENLMIVDLLRNDLGRNCRTGSIRVPELFSLESYPNVHHLVSAVSGELDSGKDGLDLIAGSFPGGSITGAPKIRAMQIIDELEPGHRSIYCGSLLYCDVRGELDSSITIRTLLIRNQSVYCWGGGGIVADSHWQSEYQESQGKIDILLRTLEAL